MTGTAGNILLMFLLYQVGAVPIILKESTPSGEAIVAISSSDPDFNKYITSNFAIPNGVSHEKINPIDVGRSFSFVAPGAAAAGTGRGFASTFNPFLLPLFFNPINLEGLGLSNFGVNNWLKGVESMYDSGFGANGEVKTVSAVNDNGHIYGNVKTITFDNRSKGSN